jgi:prepilin-type N-terminal cleavage/methylation domain-containing protein
MSNAEFRMPKEAQMTKAKEVTPVCRSVLCHLAFIRHSSFGLRHSGGFTLLEMVMAMAITSIIALSIAGVSLVLSRSYAQTQGFYSNLQSGRAAMNSMQSTLRKAKLVTGASSSSLLFWVEAIDGVNPGQINRGEMVLWTYDAAAFQLKQAQIAYPSSASAMNTTLSLANASTTPTANTFPATDVYTQWKVLANDVQAFSVSLDQAAPLTRCVKLKITTGDSAHQVTLESAVRLRVDTTAKVTPNGSGSYDLNVSN